MTLTTKKINTLLSALAVITSINLSAQRGGAEPVKVGVPNVGVVYSKDKKVQDGYTLICTTNSTNTFLVDNKGRLINMWTSTYFPGQSAYLMNDGSLMRSCKSSNTTFKLAGIGGRLEKKDWNNKLLWEWELNDTTKCLHHDIMPLPNGNILVVLVEKKRLNDVILAGRDTSKLTEKELWSESILEIQPIGKKDAKIVWRWNTWDHLVQNKYPNKENYNDVSKHPELVDINFNNDLNAYADYLHVNSIDFNPELNQILLSVRNYHELWVIDHSTSTLQAKGHQGGKGGKGGDLLYRWGNPKSYGTKDAAQLDGQHGAAWIKKGYVNEGKITIFDNRATTRSSRVIVIDPPYNQTKTGYEYTPNESYLPKTEFWSYTQSGLSEGRGGSLQGLANGNVLICETGKGRLDEITMNKDTAWIYSNPLTSEGIVTQNTTIKGSNAIFKADKYPLTFTGLKNKKIIPGAKLELNPEMFKAQITITKEMENLTPVTLSISGNAYLNMSVYKITKEQFFTVYNATGGLYDKQEIQPNSRWYMGLYKEGTYYLECNNRFTKLVIIK